MAKLTIKPETIKVVEVSPVFVLELTEKEYRVIADLVGSVGGPMGEIREVTNHLWSSAGMGEYLGKNKYESLFEYIEPINKDFV